MKPLSSADVAASKGTSAPKGPRAMVSPITGQAIGVWTGATTPKGGK